MISFGFTICKFLQVLQEQNTLPVLRDTGLCLQCHSPDSMEQSMEGRNNQQGYMECLLCHADHTKVSAK